MKTAISKKEEVKYSIFGWVGDYENFLSVGNAGGDERSGGDVEGAECRQALMCGTT